MAQIVKTFTHNLFGRTDVSGKTDSIEDQINAYLQEHPTYYAKAISAYITGMTKEAYVIFDVRDDRGGKRQNGSKD